MFSVFMYAFNALAPILILILLGFQLKKREFLTDGFLEVGNKLMFRISLPAMLFVSVYSGVESLSDIKWSIVIFALVMIAVIFVLGLVAALLFIPDRKQKGVVLQCSFRSNFAIIGLVLADGLGGSSAVAVVGILSAFSVTLFNVLAVISLTVFSDNKTFDIKNIIRGIITNPLIIGILSGVVALAFKNVFPVDKNLKFLYSAFETLGKLATPLALIVLGGRFTFKAGAGMLKQIAIATIMRIVVAPFIALGLAVILTKLGVVNFGTSEFPALIALFATPVAVSSAVMAAEMKSDAVLADQLVVWTSVFSVITIFIFIVALRSLEMI